MSRHLIRSDEQFEVVVGYDDPLDTYFVQVYDIPAQKADPDGEDVLIVWAGEMPAEITDVYVVVALVAPYKKMNEAEIEGLRMERGNRRQPTAFQRETFRKIMGEDLP